MARVVCVQNRYNLSHREDDPLLDQCAADGIAFVPFFPLRGQRMRALTGPSRSNSAQ